MTPLGWLGHKPQHKQFLLNFVLLSDVLKIAGWMANSVGPGQMLYFVVSDMGLHCLLRHVCPDTKGK